MSQSDSKRKAFKDYFNPEAVRQLAVQVESAWAEFDSHRFQRLACDGLEGLEGLEFNQRVALISSSLRAVLPQNTGKALEILRRSLPAPLPNCDSVTDGWLQWPLGQFIADYGLDEFDASMETMIELTQRFSSEFAVRPFMVHHQKRTLKQLLKLTQHDSPHVRRWCSEGCRPRLPWGVVLKSLVNNPVPVFPILDELHNDPELYVRRSVANCLNDIAKDHPEAVVERCRSYMQAESLNVEWLVRQALRTLIKEGHSDALSVLGFGPPQKLSATLAVTDSEVAIGDSVELQADITNGSDRKQKLSIDFQISYVRQKGRTTTKVFKWKTLTLGAGEAVCLHKRHSMKQTSVRRLYPGTHGLTLLINGAELADTEFELE